MNRAEVSRRECKAVKDCTVIYYDDMTNEHVDWIPPTDEERAMFREAAKHNRLCPNAVRFCEWSIEEFNSMRDWSIEGFSSMRECSQIADSLALDGADYDNMPEGYV